MRRTLVALALFVALAAPVRALMPPQYFVHAQIRAAFEGGAVKVLELEQSDGFWVVPVVLSGPDAWEINDGLATVLNRTFQNGAVRIEVRLPRGERPPARVAATRDVTGVLRTLRAALRGNPHVSGVHPHGGGVVIELRPRMISFWADNLNDRKGLVHYAPADLFRDYLDFQPFTSVHVGYSYSAE